MSSKLKAVLTENAPAPKGVYSQAIDDGCYIHVSGQLPLDPVTGEQADNFKDNMRQCLLNVKAVLEAAGSGLEMVVKINSFLTDESQFPEMNEVFLEFFTEPYPARSARVVKLGPFCCEVDALALKK